jgi:hypothetical protein
MDVNFSLSPLIGGKSPFVVRWRTFHLIWKGLTPHGHHMARRDTAWGPPVARTREEWQNTSVSLKTSVWRHSHERGRGLITVTLLVDTWCRWTSPQGHQHTVGRNLFIMGTNIGVLRGVSNGAEDGRKPLGLRAGHPWNGHKAISRVARPQDVEG